jgi:hypothetical protein
LYDVRLELVGEVQFPPPLTCSQGLVYANDWYFADYCSTLGSGWSFDQTQGTCVPPPPPDDTQRTSANGILCKANPCDILSGNKRQREVDYAPGTGALAFERTYNSGRYHSAKQGSNGKPLGESWFGSYLQFVSARSGLSSTTVNAVRPDGDVVGFTPRPAPRPRRTRSHPPTTA